MRLTYPDYIKLLKESFEKKRVNKDLSLLLAQSAPAKIRQACLHLYRKYYDKGDLQTLKRDTQALNDFFGPAEHGRQFIDVIEGFETDRFRPLDKYLKGIIESTDERNVELLAWLIDFKHRPYVFGMDVILTEEELAVIKKNDKPEHEPGENNFQVKKEAAEIQLEKETDPAKEEKYRNPHIPFGTVLEKKPAKNKYKRAVIVLLILVIGGAMLALWWQRDKQGSANAVCVYWQDDHYEQVPCNEEQKGRNVITMDSVKAKRFRRITRPDTLTGWSVGRMYYIKDSNNIKYYTEAGNYPEDVNRSLKVISLRIYEKYILKKDTAGKHDSLSDKN